MKNINNLQNVKSLSRRAPRCAAIKGGTPRAAGKGEKNCAPRSAAVKVSKISGRSTPLKEVKTAILRCPKCRLAAGVSCHQNTLSGAERGCLPELIGGGKGCCVLKKRWSGHYCCSAAKAVGAGRIFRGGRAQLREIINKRSIIICNEDKVKRYAELIKNSDMRPIAVVGKNQGERKLKKLTPCNIVLCIIVGLILGFVNGFLGGGGGMLCVPLLIFALGLPDKRAHATAILIMLPISVVSFAVYAINMEIEWMLALWVTIGSVAGGVVGSILLKKLSNSWLRAIFALIMIAAGVRMVI